MCHYVFLEEQISYFKQSHIKSGVCKSKSGLIVHTFEFHCPLWYLKISTFVLTTYSYTFFTGSSI